MSTDEGPIVGTSDGRPSPEMGWEVSRTIRRGGGRPVLDLVRDREELERTLFEQRLEQESREEAVKANLLHTGGGRAVVGGKLVSRRNLSEQQKEEIKKRRIESLNRQFRKIQRTDTWKRTKTGINYVDFRPRWQQMYGRQPDWDLNPVEEIEDENERSFYFTPEVTTVTPTTQQQVPPVEWEHYDVPAQRDWMERFRMKKLDYRDRLRFQRRDFETYSGYRQRVLSTYKRRGKKLMAKKLAYFGIGNYSKYLKVRRQPMKLEGNRYVDYKGQIRSLSMDPTEAQFQWNEEIRKSLK